MTEDRQAQGYRSVEDFDPEWSGLEDDVVDLSAWMNVAGGMSYAHFKAWRSGNGDSLPSRQEVTPVRARAINTVLRVAAAQSGAVEDLYSLEPGSTMNVGEDRPGWRSEIKVSYAASRDSGANQIDALIATYETIQREAPKLDPLPSGQIPDPGNIDPPYISEAWIRSVHESATRIQETYKVMTTVGPQMRTMNHGEYKTEPNHVILRDGGTHYYCEPIDVSHEMARLVGQLNSKPFRTAHPILQAAYAHWAITHVHPFADGNGRVARAVASLFVLNWHRIPILIFADRKLPYFKALEEADNNRPQALAQYMQGRALDTSAWLDELERDFSNPPLDADVSKLGSLLKSLQGSSLENRDTAATRVRDHLVGLIQQAVEGELANFPGRITLQNLSSSGTYASEYRDIDSSNVEGGFTRAVIADQDSYVQRVGGTTLKVRIDEPAMLERTINFETMVSTSSSYRLPILVTAFCQPSRIDIQLLLEDCSPTLSEASGLRLQSLVRRILATCVQQLQSEIEVLLDSHGKSSSNPMHTSD